MGRQIIVTDSSEEKVKGLQRETTRIWLREGDITQVTA